MHLTADHISLSHVDVLNHYLLNSNITWESCGPMMDLSDELGVPLSFSFCLADRIEQSIDNYDEILRRHGNFTGRNAEFLSLLEFYLSKLENFVMSLSSSQNIPPLRHFLAEFPDFIRTFNVTFQRLEEIDMYMLFKVGPNVILPRYTLPQITTGLLQRFGELS
jgi:hypothetical protein